jgi:hypothetical protein
MVLSASTIAITHQPTEDVYISYSSSAPTLGPQAPFSPSPKPFLNASFYHPTPNKVLPTHLSFPKLLPFLTHSSHQTPSFTPPPPFLRPSLNASPYPPYSHFLHYPPSFFPFPLHKPNPLPPSQKHYSTPFGPSHSCVLSKLCNLILPPYHCHGSLFFSFLTDILPSFFLLLP